MLANRRNFLKGIIGGAALTVASQSFTSRSFMRAAANVSEPSLLPPINSEPINMSPTGQARTHPARKSSLSPLRFDAKLDLNIENPRFIEMSEEDRARLNDSIDPASMTKCITFMVVQDFLERRRTLSGEDFYLYTSVPLSADERRINTRNSDRHYSGLYHAMSTMRAASVQKHLQLMMAGSRNGSATALARYVAGSVDRFVELMNEKAHAIGMPATFFINPNGLPANQDARNDTSTTVNNVTTPYDLARMMVVMVRDYPIYQRYTSLAWIPVAGSRGDAPATNAVIRYHTEFAEQYNVIGLKTGSTRAAGFGLLCIAKPEDDITLGTITTGHRNGNGSRWEQSMSLIESASESLRREKFILAERERQRIENERERLGPPEDLLPDGYTPS